jgi:hypothetical protein
MAALIIIEFANTIADPNSATVVLGDCIIAPGPQNGVMVAASRFTRIAVLSGSVSIGTGISSFFEGNMELLIDWASGARPSVTFHSVNESAGASVSWPTATGQSSQKLIPGSLVMLSGIVSQ